MKMNSSTLGEDDKSDNSIHFQIISSCIFVVAAFGLFGNFHVLLAIAKFPELRTKNGMLIFHLAGYHTICLAFEILSGIRMQMGPAMHRQTCYWSIFVYDYTINHQICLVLMLVCDIAFCMLQPLKYRTLAVYPYVHLMQIPCYIFGIVYLIIGFATMDNGEIMACNPPLSYIGPVMEAWNTSYLVINASIVVIYCGALGLTVFRGRSSATNSNAMQAGQKRIVKSLSALLIVFVFSWFSSDLVVRFPMFFGMSPWFVDLFVTYGVIPAVVSYAQTYYIYFAVSRDYRDAFRRLGLFGLWLRKDHNVVLVTTATGLTSYRHSLSTSWIRSG